MTTTSGTLGRDGDGSRRPFGLIADQVEALALARRLASAGRRVVHYILPPNRSSERAPNFEAASTAADVAIECTLIALAIDDTKTLRDVLFGAGEKPGIALDMAPGTVLIDFAIRRPRDSQSLLGILGMRGVSLVDAAVLGDSEALARGAASVLAGGFPDAVEAALPLLAELGRIERTGPLGSAQTAAALMGYVEAAHFTACSEALSMGKALGLRDPALAHILAEAPSEEKIVRFTKSAELVRALAEEKGSAADIIDLKRSRKGASRGETG